MLKNTRDDCATSSRQTPVSDGSIHMGAWSMAQLCFFFSVNRRSQLFNDDNDDFVVPDRPVEQVCMLRGWSAVACDFMTATPFVTRKPIVH